MQAITPHGVWLYVKDREYLLPFDKFPWFEDAKVSAVCHVRLLHGSHLFWPDLDVDLEIESLEHPERYPLMAKKR